MSTIEVHVEISYKSYVKYEFENNKLMVDRVLATAMHYPGNYGYIPNTLADDGDAVDVLIINSAPFFPGSYVQCRVLGMLITEDEKGMDQKVIALPISKVLHWIAGPPVRWVSLQFAGPSMRGAVAGRAAGARRQVVQPRHFPRPRVRRPRRLSRGKEAARGAAQGI